MWNLYRDIIDQVRALPGVTDAGMSEEVPVYGGYGCVVQGFEDASVYQRVKDAGLTTCAGQEATTPGYFETMRIPLLEGRVFDDGDNDEGHGGVVVVSKAFAERFWPGQPALGQGVAPSGRSQGPFYRVVGVVDDVARSTSEGEVPLSQPAIAIYYPIRKHPGETGSWNWWPGYITLVVRTDRADPTSLVPEVRRVVAAIDPEIPLANATSMSEIVAAAFAQISFVSLLIGIAAAVALLLSAVGLYGVISYVVARRTREIGMRMAVGAQPGEVQRMVVRESIARGRRRPRGGCGARARHHTHPRGTARRRGPHRSGGVHRGGRRPRVHRARGELAAGAPGFQDRSAGGAARRVAQSDGARGGATGSRRSLAAGALVKRGGLRES